MFGNFSRFALQQTIRKKKPTKNSALHSHKKPNFKSGVDKGGQIVFH